MAENLKQISRKVASAAIKVLRDGCYGKTSKYAARLRICHRR